MRLEDITPSSLKNVPDEELLSLHHRMHQLFGAARTRTIKTDAGGGTVGALTWASVEPIVHAHMWIVAEMKKRGMDHNVHPGLDEAKLPKAAKAKGDEVVVVPDYVSVVGSAARDGLVEANDLDILVREDGETPTYFRESLLLLLRGFFDPHKTGKQLHLLFNPQGPHGTYVPVFDLVLRPASSEATLVKAASLDKRRRRRSWRPSSGGQRVSIGRRGGGAIMFKVAPFGRYDAQKPSVKFYTDFVNVAELWHDWAKAVVEKRGSVLVSPKVDGLRTMLHADGAGKGLLYFEDAQQERTDDVPALAKALRGVGRSLIVEGELQAVAGGKYVARTELLTLLAHKFAGAQPVVFLYDVLYWDGKDVSDEPFEERLKLLREAGKALGATFAVLPQEKAESEDGLDKVARRLLDYGGPKGRDLPIEGVVTRDPLMPYSFGSTNDYAKTKRYVELKVRVLEVVKVSNGYVYECALQQPLPKAPEKAVVEINGRPYQKLGRTFVTPEKLANEGDTINVAVEELILLRDLTLTWGKPKVLGVDRSRAAYSVGQAISLGRRFGALKQERLEPIDAACGEPPGGGGGGRRLRKMTREICKLCGSEYPVGFKVPDEVWAKVIGPAHAQRTVCLACFDRLATQQGVEWDDDVELFAVDGLAWRGVQNRSELDVDLAKGVTAEEEAGPRGAAALRYWAEHWVEALPESGRGRFTYHHHWRGLTEDEAKDAGEPTLMGSDHSVHGDLRMAGSGALWGWTVFLGKTADNRAVGGDRLVKLPVGDNLQVQPKLAQPRGWLDVGRGKPAVSEPEEVGATSKTWAKFFVYDSGSYRLGVVREHMAEVFLSGGKLKGRYVFAFAPLGGRRVWIVGKPAGEKTYAEEHTLASVLKELRGKRQRWLVWGDDKRGPYVIDVQKDGEKLLAALAEEGADDWAVLTRMGKEIGQMEKRVKLADVTAEKLRKLDDGEMFLAHRAMHAMDPTESVVAAHALIVAELKRRGMKHSTPIDMEKVTKHHGGGMVEYRLSHGRNLWRLKGLPTVVPAFLSTRQTPGAKSIDLIVRDDPVEPRWWKSELASLVAGSLGKEIASVVLDPLGDPSATALLDLVIDDESARLVKAASLRVTLLGTGAEGQSERAIAGLMVEANGKTFIFDGGHGILGSDVVSRQVDAWFVTDPEHEHIADIREQAEAYGAAVMVGYDGSYHQDNVSVRPWGLGFVHEGTVAYEIYLHSEADERLTTVVVWAPRVRMVEHYLFENADLAFVGAKGWDQPVYGPDNELVMSPAVTVAETAKAAGAKKLVLVNVDSTILDALGEHKELAFGSVGTDGESFTLRPTGKRPESVEPVMAKAADDELLGMDVLQKATVADKQYTFGVLYKATNKPADPELDAHREFVEADQLQAGQWEYAKTGDRRIYLQHGVMGVVPIGEWVDLVSWPWEVEAEFTLPDGSPRKSVIPANSVWMGTLWNETGWRLVKTGRIRGFSMGGFARRHVVTARGG